jgi:23S rRNA pseudouridine2605 synthase
MSVDRLQKILARAGVAARRKAEELIREGRVTVNGAVAAIGDKADPERDAIKVDGKRVQPGHAHTYLLLNKPKGVLTAASDPEGRPTVMDLVPPVLRKALVPVGRLDFHTEGLLILTDDGDLAQRLAHPRYGCHKTYEVKVKGVPEESQIERLRRGVVLEGRRTSPCRIRAVRTTPTRGEHGGNTWFEIELAEGRSRQIREMFFRIGHPVQKLRRIAIGPLVDPAMPLGALRELTEKELRTLRALTAGTKPRATSARPGRSQLKARRPPAKARREPAAPKTEPTRDRRPPARTRLDSAKPGSKPPARRESAKPGSKPPKRRESAKPGSKPPSKPRREPSSKPRREPTKASREPAKSPKSRRPPARTRRGKP